MMRIGKIERNRNVRAQISRSVEETEHSNRMAEHNGKRYKELHDTRDETKRMDCLWKARIDCN